MKKLFIAIVTLTFLVAGCKEKSSSDTKENSEVSENGETKVANVDTKAICLLDKLSIRDKPSKKGKWLTSMSLGETVDYTGEEVLDSVSNRKFCKVQLIDGKEGWTRADLIAVNGKVAVMKEEAVVYKRPDLLTKTDKKYSPMDIIAIMDVKDDWVQVKGKRAEGKYIEENWIKSSNTSNSSVDIATAKFAGMAIAKPSMTAKIKALQELVNNNDFSTSSFIPLLEEKIKVYEEKNVIVEEAQDATESIE